MQRSKKRSKQKTVKFVITKEWVKKRDELFKEVKDGKAEIAFKGSRLEAMAYLERLSYLCGP